MHIDIISDVICPWCFIGKRRLERALALRPDLSATLSWRAFELNPDLPIDGIPRGVYLSGKFGSADKAQRLNAAISAAGRAEGIEFAFQRIRRTPNTLRAHRLIRFAGDNGCAKPIVEALFRAYFIEGLDIGLPETLGELAARAGLGRAETCEYLSGDAGTAEVRAEEQRARRLGIHAVPYFVLERDYAISGAQEPEMFLPLFDLAAGILDAVAVEA
ncbi:MAG TPA: DsbA family oxidoreductase [Stellaceae bacterium]